MTTTATPRLEAVVPRLGRSERARLAGFAVGIVSLLALGVVVQALVVSPLKYQRDQDIAYEDFRYDLADGSAPVGQVTAADTLVPVGTPVAVLRVPRLGIDDVVLAGTASSVLLSGPGHRRDTVLPGQAGASVVMGRHSVAGGVFGTLDELEVGDEITTITGQGEATYRVAGLRRSGDPLPAAAGAGRLTLVSATGTPYLPEDVLRVDAELVSEPFASPRPVLAPVLLEPAERAFASDPGAWPWLLLSVLALGSAVVLLSFLSGWWGRWHAWISVGPVVVLCGVVATHHLVTLLPNLV